MPLFTFIVLFRALSVVGTRPRSSIFSSIALAMVAFVRLAVVSLAALGLPLMDAAVLCHKLFANTLHGHLSLDGCSNELVVGEAGVLERLRQYAGRRQLQRGVHVHQVVRFATENIANAFACLPAQPKQTVAPCFCCACCEILSHIRGGATNLHDGAHRYDWSPNRLPSSFSHHGGKRLRELHSRTTSLQDILF